MEWTLVFSDGARRKATVALAHEQVNGRSVIGDPSTITAEPAALYRGFHDNGLVLESPEGEQRFIAVNKIGARWHITDLGAVARKAG